MKVVFLPTTSHNQGVINQFFYLWSFRLKQWWHFHNFLGVFSRYLHLRSYMHVRYNQHYLLSCIDILIITGTFKLNIFLCSALVQLCRIVFIAKFKLSISMCYRFWGISFWINLHANNPRKPCRLCVTESEELFAKISSALRVTSVWEIRRCLQSMIE